MQSRDRAAGATKVDVASTAPGFILVDSSFSPLFLNSEAADILHYPKRPEGSLLSQKVLVEKIKTVFLYSGDGSANYHSRKFQSGRRTYLCSLFSVRTTLSRKGPQLATAILLERSSKSVELKLASDNFSFTEREWQVVQLLTQGRTTKEIAERLQISPNTVKTFLRLVMAKTEVTTRSGIVGKLLQRSR